MGLRSFFNDLRDELYGGGNFVPVNTPSQLARKHDTPPNLSNTYVSVYVRPHDTALGRAYDAKSDDLVFNVAIHVYQNASLKVLNTYLSAKEIGGLIANVGKNGGPSKVFLPSVGDDGFSLSDQLAIEQATFIASQRSVGKKDVFFSIHASISLES